VFQSADAQHDIRLGIPACHQLGVLALLAVPVQRSGEIAGLIEVRWNKPDAFHECDVRTCQMMAAMVAEMLERTGGAGDGVRPYPMATVTAGDEDPAQPPDSGTPESEPAIPQAPEMETPASLSTATSASDGLASQCRVCGRPFMGNEAFCGNCSLPRLAGSAAEGLQSKWASLWYMKQARAGAEENEAPPGSEVGSQYRQVGDQATGPEELPPQVSLWHRPERPAELVWSDPGAADDLPLLSETFAPPSWDDAIETAWKNFLRRVRSAGRRGATAAAALLAVLLLAVAWGSRPSPGWPGVTRFESVLIKLGLAEVPRRTASPQKGNPDLRVWVDVHTALYYCPGSNLYGSTPGGQFETQREAQLDQFRSATGAVCE
jgi:hypothetical protein